MTMVDQELGDAVREHIDAWDTNVPNKRVNAFKMLLTYPQATFDDKEDLLWYLKNGQDPGMGNVITDNYGGCIISKENHHTTEGIHYHVLLYLKKPIQIRMRALHAALDYHSNVPHVNFVTNTKASIKRVAEYVTKDGDYIEDNLSLDTLRSQAGVKRPLKEQLEKPIYEQVVAGEINSAAAYRALLWAQQHWAGIHRQPDCDHMRGIWLYGPAGVGKTTSARNFGKNDIYLKPQNKWFDNYMGQKVIVLDDLDTNALNHYLKIWADRWACQGEVKGGTVWLRHDYFIVTSNYSIRELMEKDNVCDGALYDAMKRRFLEINVQEVFDINEILHLDEYNQWHRNESGAQEETVPEQGEPNPLLPMEPDFAFDKDILSLAAKRVPEPGASAPEGADPADGNKNDTRLPSLASESDSFFQSSSDTTNWEQMHKDCENDPEEEADGGCAEGESYSDIRESEPDGDDL